ncbi:MAG: argininosuccinate lyase, partial [Leptospiraceae bacterium]|nr:argininosuccinate lyase [Leptospiraceae bacterium]
DERENISPLLADDDFYDAALDLAASTDRKVSAGGTARTRQLEQLEQAQQVLSQWKNHDWRFPPLDF